MNRYDDYGLNSNETFIYRMAKTILQEQKEWSLKDIEDAINDSIELGMDRRINNDYNYNLVKSRLCNWFDIKVAE